MEQRITVQNQTLVFEFVETANCWRTNTLIDDIPIEIEIDFLFHKATEIDWEHFKDFYRFIKKEGELRELISDSEYVITELGRAFFRKYIDSVSDFKMEFSNSIYYNGKTGPVGTYFGYSYSLIYRYHARRGNGVEADTYGLYLVDIENQNIVGARRYQL